MLEEHKLLVPAYCVSDTLGRLIDDNWILAWMIPWKIGPSFTPADYDGEMEFGMYLLRES